MSIDADRALAFLERFIVVKRAISLTAWRALSHLSLGPGQVRLMRELARASPVPQGDLARRTGQDPAATSRAVNSLIELGWLRRSRGARDRREALIGLTAAGKRASRRIDRAWLRAALLVSRGLDDRDLTTFDRLAAKLAPSLPEPAPPAARTRRP
ncbi:MAG: hypothetical protein NVS2B9_00320 [Myxococcales bacterium]